MKRICFYIVSICVVIVAGLLYTKTINIDVQKVGQMLHMVPSREDAIEIVYSALADGKETVKIQYFGSKNKIESYAKNTVEKAFLIDDKSTTDDFDYLKNKYRGYTAWISGAGLYTIHYKFKYSETDKQTQWVNSEVKRIVESLEMDNFSDYEKVKVIHDYIVNHTSYDLTAKYNSAYEALKSNVTACQGYSNLAYKMFKEAGIDCRIITGIADKEPHAWNIVKVEDKWYNIDCTWDDPVGGGKHNNHYDYFLKSENDFESHSRNKEYRTKEFENTHNMAEHSWK